MSRLLGFFCFAGCGIISRGGDTTKRTVCRTTSGSKFRTTTFRVEEKYKTNRLTEEECKELHKKLVAYVEKEKPYINPDLKMGDLASALDTSSHSLSYLLNQYLNQSYYDFINEYRVTQFKKMVADSQYSRYTLTALAELCGFSSRASFFRSFKKSTGVTPNEYIRSIGGTAKEE